MPNRKVKLYVFKFLSIKLDISNLCFNFANRRREPLLGPKASLSTICLV